MSYPDDTTLQLLIFFLEAPSAVFPEPCGRVDMNVLFRAEHSIVNYSQPFDSYGSLYELLPISERSFPGQG